MARRALRLQRPKPARGFIEEPADHPRRSSGLAPFQAAVPGSPGIQVKAAFGSPPEASGMEGTTRKVEKRGGYWARFRVRSNIASTLSFMLIIQVRSSGTPQSRGRTQ